MSEILNAPKNDKKEGKPRMSVVPLDIIEELLPPAYEEGIEKYQQESWRLGFSQSRLFDAIQRHGNAYFYKGEDYDPDPLAVKYKKHHLAGLVVSALSLYWTWKTRPDLDDRPLKLLEKAKDALRNGTVSTQREPRATESTVVKGTCLDCGMTFDLSDAAPVLQRQGFYSCPGCGGVFRFEYGVCRRCK